MSRRDFQPPRARRGGRAAAGAAILLALAGCAGTPPRTEPAAAGGDAFLSLSARPSHDGVYRAGVVERSGPMRPNAAQSWVVRVARADGAAVADASLEAAAWMPDTGERLSPAPRATRLGGGRYRIDGLRFGRAGWWNVPIRITASGRTDSLAFNLILPGEAGRGGGR